MKMRFLSCILCATISLNVFSQGGTKSPYSQFGLGILSEESQGMNRGMNGVGIGLRQSRQVNTLNPASYSAVDSLTMIFDAGLFGQISNFEEGSTRKNIKTGGFDYFVGQFRLLKGVGVSFGVLPYTNISYSYSTMSTIAQSTSSITESYEGSGGLHQAFVGVGARLFSPLSIGANIGYLWGDYKRSVVTSGSSTVNTLSKTYRASVKNYKLDLGLQWEQPLSKKDILTLGATVGIGHELNASPEVSIVSVNPLSSNSDTTRFEISKGLELPMSYGVGISFNHDNKLILAADVSQQKWGKLSFPSYESQSKTFALVSGLLSDRTKVNIGAQWTPDPMKRRLYNRINYRIGAGYATPYYKINNSDGPKEFSVSAGLGIPITNDYNNRSRLNISAQWVRTSAESFITDNTFRINIGLTFNERWFAKWKVE